MIVFVDTSALYALIDQNDSNHAAASEVWKVLLDDEAAIWTTTYVLVETCALIQRRLEPGALRAFHDSISPFLDVMTVELNEHVSATEAVLAADRRDLSVVDCVSFGRVRRSGGRTVFCFDKHFREQGFQVLP